MNKAIKQYNSVDVEANVIGASPHHLIQMLLNTALAKVVAGKAAMESNNIAARGECLGSAISIIGELRASLELEKGGEIAANLDNLYEYMVRIVSEANVNNEVANLDEVHTLLSQVKEGWDGMSVE